jgi:hypothetical protein
VFRASFTDRIDDDVRGGSLEQCADRLRVPGVHAQEVLAGPAVSCPDDVDLLVAEFVVHRAAKETGRTHYQHLHGRTSTLTFTVLSNWARRVRSARRR